jgi:hypothetical protein
LNENVTVLSYDCRRVASYVKIDLEACEHPEYREELEKGLEMVKELLANSVRKTDTRFGRKVGLIVANPSYFQILTLT